jgi:hypothetical protein
VDEGADRRDDDGRGGDCGRSKDMRVLWRFESRLVISAGVIQQFRLCIVMIR